MSGHPNSNDQFFRNDLQFKKTLKSPAIVEKDDVVNIEAPGRPCAPPPTPAPTASIPRPSQTPQQPTYTLGPERPLKLFKLSDFEFLKILGTIFSLSIDCIPYFLILR